ncbi:MAG TPA: hypothetical protein PKW55_00175 [Spirochaetota bacterium]|nr:hypothetical protein [Spirochaetota bacterium]HOM37774.1 hypothetical protein [Spirochaetota bacterium]HPQ49349.1 hypothetical protein [Spirochaetota bacterium]
MLKIIKTYEILLEAFGPQNWWPSNTTDETIIGAVLTQNVSWKNVEKAIENLKNNNIYTLEDILNIDTENLSNLIISARFSKQKAIYLKNIASFFKKYDYNYETIKKIDINILRKELLKVKGIGEETCDTIMLYALEIPIFVIDAYTKRIFNKIGLIENVNIKYKELQNIFHNCLGKNVNLYNEYHALLVKLGKDFCKKKPLCNKCPLNKKVCFGG